MLPGFRAADLQSNVLELAATRSRTSVFDVECEEMSGGLVEMIDVDGESCQDTPPWSPTVVMAGSS